MSLDARAMEAVHTSQKSDTCQGRYSVIQRQAGAQSPVPRQLELGSFDDTRRDRFIKRQNIA